MKIKKIHIRANQSWWIVEWRDIIEYRDLLFFLVLRDFTAIYKQSILGPLWFVLIPLATTLLFTVIFGNVAKIPTDGLPPFMFYMCSMVLWKYFEGCMNSVSGSLIANARILGKVYFPRLTVPLSLVISNLGQFFLTFAMFMLFYAYYIFFTPMELRPSPYLIIYPFMVLHCAAVGLGVGLWLSALTVKYRDLRFALPFLSQLWLFATPVVYPTSIVPEKWIWLFALNPMSSVIEFNRYIFFGKATINADFLLIGFASGILLLISGLMIFNKVQRTFVDTI